MSRRTRVAVGLAVVAGLVVALNGTSADDKKDPSIKEIMTKAHKGGDSLIQGVGKGLKAAEPDWDEVHKKTKELVKLGTSLGKNTPPKGEKESWEKVTKKYVDNAKALDEAVDQKDKAAAQDAHKKLSGSCMECHKAHKK